MYYKDGTSMPCGPRWEADGGETSMGGHQARRLALPADAEIARVQVAGRSDEPEGNLDGLRMHLSNGKAMGALNKNRHGTTVSTLGKTVPITGCSSTDKEIHNS